MAGWGEARLGWAGAGLVWIGLDWIWIGNGTDGEAGRAGMMI